MDASHVRRQEASAIYGELVETELVFDPHPCAGGSGVSGSCAAISGAGGDMALPGAVECQGLHRDSAPPDMGFEIGGKMFERRSAHARNMEMGNYIEPLLADLREVSRFSAPCPRRR